MSSTQIDYEIRKEMQKWIRMKLAVSFDCKKLEKKKIDNEKGHFGNYVNIEMHVVMLFK